MTTKYYVLRGQSHDKAGQMADRYNGPVSTHRVEIARRAAFAANKLI
jgi:hypothetical protein